MLNELNETRDTAVNQQEKRWQEYKKQTELLGFLHDFLVNLHMITKKIIIRSKETALALNLVLSFLWYCVWQDLVPLKLTYNVEFTVTWILLNNAVKWLTLL